MGETGMRLTESLTSQCLLPDVGNDTMIMLEDVPVFRTLKYGMFSFVYLKTGFHHIPLAGRQLGNPPASASWTQFP